MKVATATTAFQAADSSPVNEFQALSQNDMSRIGGGGSELLPLFCTVMLARTLSTIVSKPRV